MADIIKTYRQTLPALRFLGRRYDDASHWGEWFENDLFAVLERAAGGAERLKTLYEDADAYLGLIRQKEGESWQYWIGMFVPVDTPVPEGFTALDFPACDIGVAWMHGHDADIFPHEDAAERTLVDAGMPRVPGADGALWSFERYVCPRYTVPDKDGKIVLDYCWYI